MRTCAAPGCPNRINAPNFMCMGHYVMLPYALRTDIWREYHAGINSGAHPNEAYAAALLKARDVIEEMEKRQPV